MVDRLGYPKDQALATSKPLLCITSPEKPDAVLDFLRCRAGLSIPQLHRFVRCCPAILTANVPSNLLPKLSLFHSLLSDADDSLDVPSPKELAALVSACASAFGYSTAARIAPALDLLRSIFAGDNYKVASALRRCPCLLTNAPKKVLASNLAVLRRVGLSIPQLRHFVRCYPAILTANVPSNLLSLFHSLLSDAGDSPDVPPPKELAVLISACASAFGYSAAARIAPTLDLLRSIFIGDNCKIASALRHCPRLLTNDPKKVLACNLAVLRRRGLDAAILIEKAPIILNPERLDSVFRIVEEELNLDNASVVR